MIDKKWLKHITTLSLTIVSLIGTATVSRAQIFNVKDFGATGNGSTTDTSAINNAIKAAGAAGGGIVYFPSGNYKSASIHLTNNVTLYLSNNAVILAASSGYDAPESNPFSSYQDFGHSHFHNALIWGEKLHNIGIVGPGKLDGNNNLSTADTTSSGQADKLLSLKLCTGITITNVTITRGGHFGILANGCSNIVVDAAQILCSSDRDAFDLINSSHVLIQNSSIQGSDDSMCLKADFALGVKMTSSDIRILHCSILSTGNNATQFGSETVGDFYDITFAHLTITEAGKAGLGITSNDGSIIDGVTYNDITISGCSTPIFIKLSDQNRPSSDPHPIGRIRNISFTNVRATHSVDGGVEFSNVIHGKSTVPITSITFSNVYLSAVGGHPTSDAGIHPPDNDDWRPRILGTLPAYGWFLRHVQGISFLNCKVDFDSNDGRPAMIVDDGKDVKLDGFTAEKGSSSAYDLGFTNSSTYQVTGSVNTSGGALRIVHSSNSTAETIAGPPVFSPFSDAYSSPQTVTLTAPDSGAVIRYTTDDTTPTASSGTVYSGPIAVSSATSIRAISSVSGMVASAVNAANYTFGASSSGGGGSSNLDFEAESLPFSSGGAIQTDANASGGEWVLLAATGVGQFIDYSLPSIPAGTYTLSMAYKGLNSRGQLTLQVDGVQIGGTLDEYSASAVYPVQTFGTVTFNSATTHTIRLTCVGQNSASSGFGLSADKFTFAPSSGGLPVDAPTFNPAPGSFSGPLSVTITTTTTGASIRYTTDGSTPTETHGTLYSGPVPINSSTVLSAIAFKSGMTDSPVTSGTYTLSIPDFTISATPASRSIAPGASTNYTVNIGNVNGFSGTVSLGVSGLPSGATGSFNPTSVNMIGSSVLTINTTTSTAPGTYLLTITGTSGSLSHSTTVTLVISSGGTAVSFEAENVAVTNSGVGTSVQTDANSSNGQWISLNATATGSWMEFTTPTINAGTYTFSMMWKGNTGRGISDFSIDGTTIGGTLDQYSSSQTYPTTTIGTITFSSSGTHKIRMHDVGKNSASSAFTLSADKFTFAP